MWARAVHEDIQILEGHWWCWPAICSSLRSIANKIVFHWESPPLGLIKFNVTSIALEDKAGCGGILRDDKGVACALFLGLIVAKGSKMVEIIAIKTVVDLFIGLSWHVNVPLVIKSSSSVIV